MENMSQLVGELAAWATQRDVRPSAKTTLQLREMARQVNAELERLRKVEEGRVALFARLDVRDELKYFDKDMTTGELRGFFGGAS